MVQRPHLPYAAALCLWATVAHAQTSCLLSEDFQAPGLPAGWSSVPGLVTDDNGGNTAPWVVGTAAAADANGYFPLPDDPVGNLAALANDDAPPCDCSMDDVSLISPVIDLTGTAHAGLHCRVYHDGRPFNTHAWVEASADGVSWTLLQEVPAVLGDWQEVLLNLDGYAGGPVQLRFRYSDGGTWASGMAVDDICVFARPANDVEIVQATIGDATISPFLPGERSLPYSHMPLEQASELVATARIRNLGHTAAAGLTLTLEVDLNGTTVYSGSTAAGGALAPLADTLWVVHTGWTADATGNVTLAWTLTTDPADEDTGNNSDTTRLVITGPGVVNNQMALDNGIPETFIDNDGAGFSTGCRFELRGGGTLVHGLAVKVGGGSQPGARMTALLTDGELNVLAAATTDTLTQADLDLCYAGGWMYLPFNQPVAIPQDRDVMGLVRYDAGFGDLQFGAGGKVPLGSALRVGSDGFSVSYPQRAPLVRLVLQDPVTGTGPSVVLPRAALAIVPNPAHSWTHVEIPEPNGADLRVVDAAGRTWTAGRHPQGWAALNLDHLPPGLYVVELVGRSGIRTGKLLVTP
jgi:hypothetical protein